MTWLISDSIGPGHIGRCPVDYKTELVAFGDSGRRDAFGDRSFRIGSAIHDQDCSTAEFNPNLATLE